MLTVAINLLRKILGLLARGLLYLFLTVLILGPMYGAYYAYHLNDTVRGRFEGKRWSLPARVYARPLELYAGRPITPTELQEEINRLNYSNTKSPQRPGSYVREGDQFLIYTRPFQFQDRHETSHFIDVRFYDQKLTVVKDVDTGKDLALASLDPVLITSIYPNDKEDRILILRKDLPQLLVQTLVAVEDRQFFSHYGIDPIGIVRALWSNLSAGHVVQGGSTLTQQLVKNFYLSNKRSMTRKLNEAIMALLLDSRYSKDQILETYANEVYLGQDGSRAIHGFGLASHFFFNRDLEYLDLPRIALLVGIIKGPSYYDPRRHPQRALSRRNVVLDTMVEQGLITADQAIAAKATDLGLSAKGQRVRSRYSAFMDLVRIQLQNDYRDVDLRSEGLSIFTTLDPLVQTQAEHRAEHRLPVLERTYNVQKLETAAVIASVEDGEIMALVGGRHSVISGFNRAINAVRSIGSLVKPVVYLEALSRPEYNLFTPIPDEPVLIKGGRRGRDWKPQNYDRSVHGMVPLQQALVHSYNLSTVNLGLQLGLSSVASRLRAFGVKRAIPEYNPLLLGAISLSPLEVTQIYQCIASGGFLAPLRTVRAVLDSSGKHLNHYPVEVKQVANPQAVALVTWAMRQVVERGTARDLHDFLPADFKVAGKTGTTDDYIDSWFAGFTGDKVAVVWVGRDDNRSAGLSGSKGALQVWGDIIGSCDNESLNDTMPDGLVMQWVNSSGEKVSPNCPNAYEAPFRKENLPRRYGSCSRNSR